VGDFPQSVAIGDLDGDGDQDLAVALPALAAISFLRNAGDGTFDEGDFIDVDFLEGVFGAIADVDGDEDHPTCSGRTSAAAATTR